MSRLADVQAPTGHGTTAGRLSVMAALEPDQYDEDVVLSAVTRAGPDGFVVMAFASRPHPLVTHYWFMSEFGSMLWRSDKALPEASRSAVTRASNVLDQAGVAHVLDEVTCRESALGGRNRRLVAEALAEVAARHDVEVIVVGRRRGRGSSVASHLRDLTGRIVVETPIRSPDGPEDGIRVFDLDSRRSRWQRIPSTLAPRSTRPSRSWGQQVGPGGAEVAPANSWPSWSGSALRAKSKVSPRVVSPRRRLSPPE